MRKFINLIATLILFGIVDKIENDHITIELYRTNGGVIDLPLSMFPFKVAEGDCLYFLTTKKRIEIINISTKKTD
jgi:hypothetical protein